MFNQIYSRMGSNQKLPISFITWREKKHTPNLHFGTALRWWAAWRQSAGWIWRFQPQFQPLRLWGHGFLERKKPPKAICMRYAEVMVYFKGEKMWIWEKLVFQFVFFWLLLKRNNIHQKGKKCSQPAQTNPIVGLPFFTNSKAYQEPSNGQQ